MMGRIGRFIGDTTTVFRGMWRVAPMRVVFMIAATSIALAVEPLLTVGIVAVLVLAIGLHAQFSTKAQAAIARDRAMEAGEGYD